MGEIGEGAVLNLAVVAKGFPEEDRGRGVAVGDGGDIHDFCISLIKSHVKDNLILTCLPCTAQIPPTLSHRKTSINYRGKNPPESRNII